MSTLRLEKVNELIKQKVGEILVKDISFKLGVFATVVKADVSPDLRRGAISVSVFPASEGSYVIKTLKKEIYTIQGKLNRELHMHPLPRIFFRIDTTEEEAQKVEDILQELHNKD